MPLLSHNLHVKASCTRNWGRTEVFCASEVIAEAASPADYYIQGPGLPGLCPGAYEAGMPHPSPHGCVYGVARRQAGQSRAVPTNFIGSFQYFGSTPVSHFQEKPCLNSAVPQFAEDSRREAAAGQVELQRECVAC